METKHQKKTGSHLPWLHLPRNRDKTKIKIGFLLENESLNLQIGLF